MNESLAKQLHDLVKNYKISVADEINDTTRRVNTNLENMEDDINKLIVSIKPGEPGQILSSDENGKPKWINQNQDKPNEQQ